MAQSLYIHIPFCRSKCPYCDFNSRLYQPELAKAYIDALVSQINKLQAGFSTIYVGGGTPSVLEFGLLKKLFAALSRIGRHSSEFSVEANPESLNFDKLKLFFDCGCNRISIGLQSLFNKKLEKLGRAHRACDGIDKVFLARKCGFLNIGIDLIFGVWSQTLADWRNELALAINLPVKHISAYSLTYEKGTPIFGLAAQGKITPLDETVACGMYEHNLKFLPGAGFSHYEVSNFAKKGYACRHNINYWRNQPCLGLGAGAVSYVRGVRRKYTNDISDYLQGGSSGGLRIISCEELPPSKRARETAALGIRTREGIDFKRFRQQTGFEFTSLLSDGLESLRRQGLLRYKKRFGARKGVCLTDKGFLFCDTVSAEFL